jgi:glycosyltransferase involved in cell wall biosynthesis
MLSVIIITKNEAHVISDCLASAAWADEIVVVDSGSDDDTVEICQKFGALVSENEWSGYGKQKNHALARAKGDWILSIDADERVTPALRQEIEHAIANPNDCVAWQIPRLSSFCGRFMHHSGWWPDYVIRLFHRDHAKFSDDRVHERVIVKGLTGTLTEHFLHESIENLEELLTKMNQYTTAGALMSYERKQTTSLTKAIGRGFWAFFRCYILRAGFLDGREGFILSVSTAESTYYRHLKLMLLMRKK